MENRAHALAAGLFAILLGAGVVFAIWWFSGQRVPMREIVLEARGDINGLGAQSRVRYRGMAVGSVRAVAIDPEDLRTLLVRIAVPADLPLTRGTTAALGTLGVTGLAFVQLDDRGVDRRPLAAAAGEVPRIALQPGLVEALSGRALAALDQFQALGERLQGALASLESAAAGVDRGVAELPATLAALRAALSAGNIARITSVLGNLERGSAEAVPAVAELRRLIVRIDQAAARLELRAAAAGDDLVERTLPQLDVLLGELTSTSQRFGHLVEELDASPQLLLTGRDRPLPGPGEAGHEGFAGSDR
ncbi:MAG TPA: MlaD family protein [Thauera aminoaromatica]|nr:MlaD family protein [Thauera aminoaromatica]